jgi:capsular polysaccharide biosynthesis protein
MKLIDIRKRIRNIRNQKHSALLRFMRRIILKLAGIRIIDQTEIQYINQGIFNSRVISVKKIENSINIEKRKNEDIFEHNFSAKYLVTLYNVVVNTESGFVYAINKYGKYFLISESTEWPTDRAIIYSEKPPFKIECEINFGALGLPNSGFAHLMSEDLPNLLRIKSRNNILFYIKSNSLNHQIFEAGKFKKNIVPKWVRVSKLEMVTKGKDVGYLHPESLKLIRKFKNSIVLENNKKSKEKYYISRVNFTRSSKFELKIQEYFEKLGFQIVYPEKLSLIEQVKLFSNARVIAGIHGGGIFHSVWNDSCDVIELMPANRVNRCFEWQTFIRKTKYLSTVINDLEINFTDIKRLVS